MNARDLWSRAIHWAAAGASQARRDGLAWSRHTVCQAECLEDDAPIVVWRDGNRLGKSRWLAEEALHVARGTHPHWRRRAPTRVLVIGVSLEQMVPLMAEVWALVPKGELDPRNSHEPGRGITGKPPRLVFVRGPGRGSVIAFATYRQGATRIAGGGYDLVIMDEPPPQSMYDEVLPRVLTTHGRIRIGFTPTLDMPDMAWMRKLCDAGVISHHNWGLKAEYCLPEGWPAPWNTQEEIDAFEASLLPVHREMRMGRSWEPVLSGRVLAAFWDHNIRRDEPPPGAILVCGNDHGVQEGKQGAVLVACWDVASNRPKAAILGEYVGEGLTRPENDAVGIISMIRSVRLGGRSLDYDDVDVWVGDRPAEQRRRASSMIIRKSNSALRRALADALHRPLSAVKWIEEVAKFSGSEISGLELLNSMAGRAEEDGTPHLIVWPTCPEWIRFAKEYRLDPHDPRKDIGDAGRYAVERGCRISSMPQVRPVYYG